MARDLHDTNPELKVKIDTAYLRHALDTGLKKSGHEHSQAKFTAEQVRYIREICIPGDKEFGFNALAIKFNVSSSTIERIYNRKRYRNVI